MSSIHNNQPSQQSSANNLTNQAQSSSNSNANLNQNARVSSVSSRAFAQISNPSQPPASQGLSIATANTPPHTGSCNPEDTQPSPITPSFRLTPIPLNMSDREGVVSALNAPSNPTTNFHLPSPLATSANHRTQPSLLESSNSSSNQRGLARFGGHIPTIGILEDGSSVAISSGPGGLQVFFSSRASNRSSNPITNFPLPQPPSASSNNRTQSSSSNSSTPPSSSNTRLQVTGVRRDRSDESKASGDRDTSSDDRSTASKRHRS